MKRTAFLALTASAAIDYNDHKVFTLWINIWHIRLQHLVQDSNLNHMKVSQCHSVTLCVRTLQPRMSQSNVSTPKTSFRAERRHFDILFQVLRAVWNDSESSSEVEKILKNLPALDLWAPESLEYVHDTQSADFMIPNHLADNVMKLFRKDHQSQIFEKKMQEFVAF